MLYRLSYASHYKPAIIRVRHLNCKGVKLFILGLPGAV